METNDLKIFQTIARLGSISQTAEQMGYTQSNITARLKVLESELQTPLFQRTNKGVNLLPHGETLLGYANTILECIEKAKVEIIGQAAMFTIGATPIVTQTHMTKWWMDNGCNFSIYTRSADELASMLEAAYLDGILVNQEIQNSHLTNM